MVWLATKATASASQPVLPLAGDELGLVEALAQIGDEFGVVAAEGDGADAGGRGGDQHAAERAGARWCSG